MGSGGRHLPRALAVAAAFIALAASPASATRSNDASIARAGLFVVADFPAGFQGQPGSDTSAAEIIKLAKGVDGCAPYTSLLKTSIPLPQATSSRFGDTSRSVSNQVVVYPSERAAAYALTLYAKSSVVGCIENLAEKQARSARPDGSLDDVTANLDRQDIAGLGDDSVVYEGNIALTKTDDSKSQFGVGSAAVRVGRAVDIVMYTSTSGDLSEVLTPAIDASVLRMRSALTRSGG
jgi:hypothetical protein